MLNLKEVRHGVAQLALEKNLSEDKIWEAVEISMARAYKKEYLPKASIVRASINQETGDVKFEKILQVVDDTMVYIPTENDDEEETIKRDENDKRVRFNSERHILFNEAKIINSKISLGEEIIIPLEQKDSFSRIAAQVAKQSIVQQIKELEKQAIVEEFESKTGDIVTGVVQKIYRNNVFVNLGKVCGILPYTEAIQNERLLIGEKKKFLIVEINENKGSLEVVVSRNRNDFIFKLLELEVPEIQEGLIDIKGIVREPGFRAKISVESLDEDVDAVGACIGPRGSRISTLLDEIAEEKFDIVEYSEEPATYLKNALSPIDINDIEIDSANREIKAFVNPENLSIAIGKKGQNVRLASKLIGWDVKIIPTLVEETKEDNK